MTAKYSSFFDAQSACLCEYSDFGSVAVFELWSYLKAYIINYVMDLT